MRLQISLQLAPNPTIGTFFTNLRPVILPVFWFDAEAAITEDIADQLKLIGGFFYKTGIHVHFFMIYFCRYDA